MGFPFVKGSADKIPKAIKEVKKSEEEVVKKPEEEVVKKPEEEVVKKSEEEGEDIEDEEEDLDEGGVGGSGGRTGLKRCSVVVNLGLHGEGWARIFMGYSKARVSLEEEQRRLGLEGSQWGSGGANSS